MSQVSRYCYSSWRLWLCLMMMLMVFPTASAQAQSSPWDYLGWYYPNTLIEQRDDQFWLVRSPYESPLVDIGDGLLGITQGYLAGTPLQLQIQPDGSKQLNILRDGAWLWYASSQSPYTLEHQLSNELDRILDQAVANGITGVSLAIEVPGLGRLSSARGLADRNVGVPWVPYDPVRIASVSKMFVATVALQLVQEGWLSLDQTVEHWLPGMVPNGDSIHVRQLLNHTSGVPDYLTESFAQMAIRDSQRIWQPHELVSRAVAGRTIVPGRGWAYSNTNYVLLGLIIERVTNTPLNNEIRNRILWPLGMQHTYLEPEDQPVVVRTYENARDLTHVNLSLAWGAGHMSASPDDLNTFIRALNEGRLLGPELQAQMHDMVWSGARSRYGLGLMQYQLNPGVRADGQARPAELGIVRGHTGGLMGARSVVWYAPASGISITVAINNMFADPNRVAERALQASLNALESACGC